MKKGKKRKEINMTENNAIYRFKDLKHSYEKAQKGSALQEVLNVFITLEDLEMAIEALEKQSMVNELLHECKKMKIKLEQYQTIGTTEDCRNVVEEISKIKDIIHKRNIAFDGQEFGTTYCDLDNIIEEIRDVLNENETELER